jgi:hypothetical protein
MILKNTSKACVVCESLGFAVDPGDTIEIEDGYCAPRLSVPGTASQEPIIRLLCPQLVPADDALLADWVANRPLAKAPPPPPPTALDLEATGLSPGVAALAASGQAAVAPRPPARPGQPIRR